MRGAGDITGTIGPPQTPHLPWPRAGGPSISWGQCSLLEEGTGTTRATGMLPDNLSQNTKPFAGGETEAQGSPKDTTAGQRQSPALPCALPFGVPSRSPGLRQ